MYKHNLRREQLPLFSIPFGEHLSPDNKWVKLARLVPWDEIEDLYKDNFSKQATGPCPITARMAFGALIIKEELKLTDRLCVEQITENPYLQYFCGLDHFITEAPFDASMFVHFRKRFSMNVAVQINERIFEKMRRKQTSPKEPSATASGEKTDEAENLLDKVNSLADTPCLSANIDDPLNAVDEKTESSSPTSPDEEENKSDQLPNNGKLIVDASCTPADIRYPTDLSLLNEAREKTEVIIDGSSLFDMGSGLIVSPC